MKESFHWRPMNKLVVSLPQVLSDLDGGCGLAIAQAVKFRGLGGCLRFYGPLWMMVLEKCNRRQDPLAAYE
jgi:hypothetical protein